jgi:hypothetical protein
MRNILFIIFGLIILGCSKQSDKKDVWVSMNYMGDVDSLAALVVQGDSDAFDQLRIGTMADELNGSAILPYAFMMADKYHYSRAYYFVYWKLVSVYSVGYFEIDSINTIPEQTRNLALKYLKKGVDSGNEESLSEWRRLIEKKLIDPNDYK